MYFMASRMRTAAPAIRASCISRRHPTARRIVSYAEIQKAAFEAGLSAPDFAPDNFEVDFRGRFTRADLSPLGLREMGY